jgi:hypothetical protein
MNIRPKASLNGTTGTGLLKGEPGDNGATFTPNLDEEGNLSWSNDKGLPNPKPVNIRGPKGDPPASPSGGFVAQDTAPEDTNLMWVDTSDDNEESPGGIVDAIPVPATAEIGQTIVVKAVDENGKPTEWEAADMVSGGDENLRLINSVVVGEDVNVLSVTTDSDGKSFSLKKVKVFVRIRGNTSDAASWCRMTVNNLRQVFYIQIIGAFAVVDGQDYYYQNRVDISIHDGHAWCDLVMRSNNNAASKNSLQYWQYMGQEMGLGIGIKKIESVDVYSSGAGIGAGTEMVIWGVDAE